MADLHANPDLEEYRRHVRERLKQLAPIFAKASIGDFSTDVKMPEDDEELAIFFVGVQIILDAIREKVDESESTLARLNALNSELEHDKATYQAILSSIAEGLVVVDKAANITLINQAAADMLGLDPKAVIGLYYYDVVVTKDRDGKVVPVERRPLKQAVTAGKKHIYSLAEGLHYVRSNGSSLPVAITASPVKLGEEIIGGVSTFRDITVEKQLDRTKSEIISIASHQLRTPLTAIKWLSEQLVTPVKRMTRASERKYLQQIHSSNERMITLVNDLLNVSRVELGTFTQSPASFDLSQLVGDILKDLGSQINAKHLRVKQKIDPGLDDLFADPRHVQVIIQNLLVNAVKYTPTKKSILITAKKRNKHELYIAIKDEGCGIPLEQQNKVFSKLFRGDNARVMATEGSGLGLYVCKAIVEQLGGKIWFESVENKGSTFYVSLPLATPPVAS